LRWMRGHHNISNLRRLPTIRTNIQQYLIASLK
jgi:hypothetical protein